MQNIRPSVADINLDNVAFNVQAIRTLMQQSTELMAIVKADAYGHGAIEVAAAALSAGANRLGVAVVEEAVELRRAGIGSPILILGYAAPESSEQIVKLGLTATVYDRDGAMALSSAATRLGRRVKVHIKVDTGMGRLGIRPSDLVAFYELLMNIPHLEVEGVFTHLACADSTDTASAKEQLKVFRECCQRLDAKGLKFIRHAANTAAILSLPDSHLDMVRLGLGLYGMYPSAHLRTQLRLKPVMSLRSRLSHVKWVEDETPIGYGATYRSSGRRQIATVPIGYADGYSRRLSSVGQGLLHGRRVSLVGRVCMDQCMFDVTGVDAMVGDEIILMGGHKGAEITVDEIADQMGTINYEVTCLISRRVPRVFLRNNQIARVRTLLGRM